MTPSRKLTAEDLEDGSLLKEAVSIFNKERNEDHFIDILEFLRDSYVWIPCNAVMSEADMARYEQAITFSFAESGYFQKQSFSFSAPIHCNHPM